MAQNHFTRVRHKLAEILGEQRLREDEASGRLRLIDKTQLPSGYSTDSDSTRMSMMLRDPELHRYFRRVEADIAATTQHLLEANARFLRHIKSAEGDPVWMSITQDAKGRWMAQPISRQGPGVSMHFDSEQQAQEYAQALGFQIDDQSRAQAMVQSYDFRRNAWMANSWFKAASGQANFASVRQDANRFDEVHRAFATEARNGSQALVTNGTCYLVVDNIAPGDEQAVYLHEQIHMNGRALMEPKAIARLAQQVRDWSHKRPGSVEAQIERRVRSRLAQADVAPRWIDEETIAYAVEEAVHRGIRPSAMAQPESASAWLDQVVTVLREGLRLQQGQAENFPRDLQQLVDWSYALAQLESPQRLQRIYRSLNAQERDTLYQRLSRFLPDLQPPEPAGELAADALQHGGQPEPESDTPVTGFYSALKEALSKAPVRETPSAWQQWLGGLEQAGVKRSEIAWSGLQSYLELAARVGQDYVSRVELQQWLRTTGPALVQRMRHENTSRPLFERPVYTPHEDAIQPWGVYDDRDRLMARFASESEAYVHLAEHGLQGSHAVRYDDARLAHATRYRELTLRLDGQAQYSTETWPDEANVLAHIRLSDVHDRLGQRMLVIEEIDSQWASDGQRHGFGGRPMSFGYDAASRTWQVHSHDHSLSFSDSTQALQAWRALKAVDPAVPRAPFVEDGRAWMQLALKRVLQLAVEEGYDGVAMLSGEQAAHRLHGSYSVDGAPLRSMYDEVMPQEMEKLLDAMGGLAKVRSLDLRQWPIGWTCVKHAAMWQVFDEHQNVRAQAEFKAAAMKQALDGLSLGLDQPQVQAGFLISDELRMEVAQGLPLFSRQARQMAYHGSGQAGIERLDPQYAGQGTGELAYGVGVYFSADKAVADGYRVFLAQSDLIDAQGQAVVVDEKLQWLLAHLCRHQGNFEAASTALRESDPNGIWVNTTVGPQVLQQWQQKGYRASLGGATYRADIPAQHSMLDWDAPLHAQPDAVREVIEGSGLVQLVAQRIVAARTQGQAMETVQQEQLVQQFEQIVRGITGGSFYRNLSQITGSDQAASQTLSELGLPGITYQETRHSLDGQVSTQDARNFVVFRADDIHVLDAVTHESASEPSAPPRQNRQSPRQPALANKRSTMTLQRQHPSRGVEKVRVGNVNSDARMITGTRQGMHAFWAWFGQSQTVDAQGRPRVYFHTTRNDFTSFEVGRPSHNSSTWGGDWQTTRAAIFVTADRQASQAFGEHDGQPHEGAQVMPLYVRAERILDMRKGCLDLYERAEFESVGFNPAWLARFDWSHFDDESGRAFVQACQQLGYDAVLYWDEHPDLTESFEALAVFSPEQIKSALGNRGTFDPDDADITRSVQPAKRAPLGLYSALAQQAQRSPTRSATPAAWKAMIRGWINKGWAKQEELKWSGLMEYLDLQEGKITKEQITAYLEHGGVQVEETTLGRAYNDDGSEKWEYEGEAKYSRYTLPGGEDYREVLLMLPTQETVATREQFSLFNEDGRLITQGMWPPSKRTQADLAANPNWRIERHIVADQNDARRKGVYQSSHWSQPNVLAHLRLTDRTDSDGSRVLFVEEIQSDWAKDGRDKGFDGQASIAVRPSQDLEADDDTYDVLIGGRVVGYVHADSEDEAQQKAQVSMGNSPMRSGVPAAPFVTTTGGWLNLVLKRLVVMAADGGYDKVAFVNGEQAADLYNLSKRVSRVFWNPETGHLGTLGLDRLTITNVANNVVAEDLAKFVGKPAAKHLIAAPVNDRGFKVIEGDALAVGGQGLQAFYDEIVPNTLKSLLPKVGGEGLQQVVFGGGQVDGRYRVIDQDSGAVLFSSHQHEEAREYWRAYDGEAEIVDTRKEALGDRGALVGEQAGFIVTDAMRQQVGTEGVPMFSRKAVSEPTHSMAMVGMPGPRFAFHVTPAANLDAILRHGLQPLHGERSEALGETGAAVYAFPGSQALTDGLMNWLGDAFDDDEVLALLAIDRHQLDDAAIRSDVGYEIAIGQPVPPEALVVVSTDLDDEPDLDDRLQQVTERYARSPLTQTLAFEKWFAQRGLKDEQGLPRVFYHGSSTPENLTAFVPGGPMGARQTGDAYGVGSYFSSDADEAAHYAGDSGAVFAVYLRGDILDLDAQQLPPEHARRLNELAAQCLLPSDKARFSLGRAEQVFPNPDDARDFFEAQLKNWEAFGDGMDRARPVVSPVSGGGFLIEYTDFDAGIDIRTGADAYTLLRAVGFDNLGAMGFDGLIMSRGGGRHWVVMAHPDGNVKSAVGNNGQFDPASRDITHSRQPRAQTDTAEFKEWFKDSQVVDEQGQPLVVYHGTSADFAEFKAERLGAFFASSPDGASAYAGSEAGSNVMPAYLSIKNPYAGHVGRRRPEIGEVIAKAKRGGHDGAIVTYDDFPGERAYVAFHPEQIKSATGNNGRFDPTDADITRSVQPRAQTDTAEFKAWFGHSKVVDEQGQPLVLYHGTVADITEFNKAETADGGFHFGTVAQASMRVSGESKNLMPVHLSATNLQRSKDMGGNWRGKIKAAKAAGKDGIVYLNRYEGLTSEVISRLSDEGLLDKLDGMSDAEFRRAVPEAEDSYIVFRPEQIKSAVGNRGTFDPTDPDITHSRADRGVGVYDRAVLSLIRHAARNTGNVMAHLSDAFEQVEALNDAQAVALDRLEAELAYWVNLASSLPKNADSDALKVVLDQIDLEIDEAVENGTLSELLGQQGQEGERRITRMRLAGVSLQVNGQSDIDEMNRDVTRSFAGYRSASADQYRLELAQSLRARGVEAERVRQQTGWFQGFDGMWRFEIADDDAVFRHVPALSPEQLEQQYGSEVVVQADGDLFKAVFAANTPSHLGGWGRTPEQARENVLRVLGKKLNAKSFDLSAVKVGEVYFLEQMLQHPRLFAAYPDLAQVRVTFVEGVTFRGQYTRGEDAIDLNLSMLSDPDELMSVLLHEIQHSIQERERFALGGSPSQDVAEGIRDRLKRLETQYRERIDRWKWEHSDQIEQSEKTAQTVRYAMLYESVQRLKKYAQSERPSSVLRFIRSEMQWIYTPEFKGNEHAEELQRAFYAMPKRHRMAERNAFLRDVAWRAAAILMRSIPSELQEQFKADERTIASMLAALRRQSSRESRKLQPLHEMEKQLRVATNLNELHRFSTTFDIYESLAGEVEARNTQARQHMSDQERLQRSPVLTQDVPSNKVVVMLGWLNIKAPMLCALVNDGDVSRSFAGPKARTSDHRLLKLAQQLLAMGEDGSRVRQQTGWYQGVDKRWRFEITDHEAQLNPVIQNLKTGGWPAFKTQGLTYRANEDGTFDVVIVPVGATTTDEIACLNGMDMPRLATLLPKSVVDAMLAGEGQDDLIGDFELAKRLDVPFDFPGLPGLMLDEVLQHPRLFAAYPELKDIVVQVDTAAPFTCSFIRVGSESNGEPQQRRIVLGSSFLGWHWPHKALEVLHHEIQHAIQEIEGFAMGGTVDGMDDPNKLAQELRERLETFVQIDDLAREQGVTPVHFAAHADYEPTIVQRVRELVEGGYWAANIEAARQRLLPAMVKYHRLAGEVEARNASARLSMDAEQRLASEPSETADTADQDCIVRFEPGQAHYRVCAGENRQRQEGRCRLLGLSLLAVSESESVWVRPEEVAFLKACALVPGEGQMQKQALLVYQTIQHGCEDITPWVQSWLQSMPDRAGAQEQLGRWVELARQFQQVSTPQEAVRQHNEAACQQAAQDVERLSTLCPESAALMRRLFEQVGVQPMAGQAMPDWKDWIDRLPTLDARSQHEHVQLRALQRCAMDIELHETDRPEWMRCVQTLLQSALACPEGFAPAWEMLNAEERGEPVQIDECQPV